MTLVDVPIRIFALTEWPHARGSTSPQALDCAGHLNVLERPVLVVFVLYLTEPTVSQTHGDISKS
ncbi:hypothetical protein YTPLAS72_01190 [Nitrospira sp.]|nr:hypothetical protein YTPLAS72_01190 [Nitrospira sp.]